MVVRILKTYIMKSNIPLRMFTGHRIRLVKDLNIAVHDLYKTLDSCHAALKLLRKLDDPPDCSNQCTHIHHIGHQITGHDLSSDHKDTARHQQYQIHHTVKGSGRSLKSRHKLISFLLDMKEIDIVLLKLLFFLFLIGKSLHHLLPEKAVLNAGVQLTDLHTLLTERLPHTQIDHRAGHHHNRYHRKKDQCQTKADPGQDHEGNDRLDTRNKKFLRTVMGKLCHIKQIIGDPPHDLTHFGIIIVCIGQLLQVRIGVPPHIRLDPRSHDMPGIRHIEIGH